MYFLHDPETGRLLGGYVSSWVYFRGRSTAGLPIGYTHTKHRFADEPEGLRRFRDHRGKALGEENPDLSGLFLFRHYFESYIE